MIAKLKNKPLEESNKYRSLVTGHVSGGNLSRRLIQLVLSLGISGLALVLVVGLFLFNARQIQAAPSFQPTAAPGTIVTHTAVGSATHQMTVFGNGQLTNQFLTDNAIRTNQIGASISHTTIAVLFDQHPGNAVDVASQLEFVETTPIFTGPATISGFYEQSYGVYASQSPSPSYQITQRTLVTSANNCVIMELTVSNTGVISLTGGRLLYMMDIQVGESPIGDEGGFDPNRQMVYQTDFNDVIGNGYAFGISLLSGDLRGYAVRDQTASYLDPASDSALRNEMITPTNAIIDSDDTNDDDVSWLVVNIPTLSPLQSTYLAFNLCGRTAASETEAFNEMNDTFDSVSNLSAVKTSVPASGSPIRIGDLITYTIAVNSTGSWYVDNIVLTDTIPAETDLITYSVTQGSIIATGRLITATIGRLYPASGTVTVTIVADPQETAFGSDTVIINQAFVDSQPVITQTNIVTHNSTVVNMVKTGPATAAVDETVVYNFNVSTNITLTTVTVTDTIAGPATYAGGDDGNSLLEPGENWVYTASYEITPFDPLYLQNTGYVSATDIYGNHVRATDTHTTSISFAPGLLIQKTGPAVARVGDTVVYDIIVTNATTNTFFGQLGALSIGDGSPITITQVTDSLGPVTYMGGDNGDGRLSGTEQWTYRITHTNVSSIPNPLFSQASVEGRDMENDVITDTDTMNTYIDTTIYFDIFLPVILKN